MVAEITSVADLMNTAGSGHSIKWVVQMKGDGNTGGSATVLSDESRGLADLVEVKFGQEFYPLDKGNVIGRFRGEPILLFVE